MAPQTYLITGTSDGIGLELVRQLASEGHTIYATVRKRESSMTGVDKISSISGNVHIIEGCDVTDDNVGDVLRPALANVTLDVVVHNAGGINGTRDIKGMAIMADQKLDVVTPARMMAAFDLNCVGVLRVHQAICDRIASPGGKIAVISTGMGSIGDNASGGTYAYRCSKAAVNMLAKGMSADLRQRGISVAAVNPNMVATNFGPGFEALKSFKALPVEQSCADLRRIFDDLITMENSGSFFTVCKDGSAPKVFPGGW